jgi:hypothetical protein
MVPSNNRYPRHVPRMSRNQNKEQSSYFVSSCSQHANGSCASVTPTCHVASLHCPGTKSTLYRLPSHMYAREYCRGVIPELVSAGAGERRVFARACATLFAGRVLCSVNDCCMCSCCRDNGPLQLALVRQHRVKPAPLFFPA